jgi:hypothetical protein
VRLAELARADPGKRFHDAPDRAQKTYERPARHRCGKHNHSFFQRRGLGRRGFFQRDLDRVKGGRVDAFLAVDHHWIVLEVIVQFVGAANVNLIGGGAAKDFAPALNIERLAGRTVGGEEAPGPFFGEMKLSEFGDDDRPTKKREDEQSEDGDFSFGGWLFKSELQRAVGQQGGKAGMYHG